MRVLAEYVMRGRTQAMLVTVISAGTVLFYWLGAAVLALVTLRKGSTEGLLLLLWSSLPASAVAWYGGEIAPLVVLSGCWVGALALRHWRSWPAALVAMAAFGLAVSGVVYLWHPQWLDTVQQVFAGFMENLRSQMPAEATVPEYFVPGPVQITGMVGLVHGLTMVLCLVLARSWQAGLYNPGGFQQEFHALRLPPGLATLVAVVVVAIVSVGMEFLSWAYLAAVPLLVSGLALVHGLVAIKGWSGIALVFAYGVLLLVNPAKELLILAALLDSWLDFRGRLASRRGTS